MSVLDRKLWRDLWRIRGQVLAIALVVGCGLSVFIMSFGVMTSLEETRIAYYERARFADVFSSLKRAPLKLEAEIEHIPGVITAESRIVEGATLDIEGFAEPVLGQLVSIPETGQPLLNRLILRQGRWIASQRPDEIILNEPFAEAHGLRPGDRLHANINGKRRHLKVVGIALSPEFVYAIAPGSLMPDDKRFGVLWMGREALAGAFDLDEAFNQLSVALTRGAKPEAVIDSIDLRLAKYGVTRTYEREDHLSDRFLTDEIDELRTRAEMLPTIFLVIAAFLLNTVVGRLIELERSEIGLLKAFGYTPVAVLIHYLKLVAAIAAPGIALGCIGGLWMGRGLTLLYGDFFRFPFLTFRFEPSIFVIALLISLTAAFVGTFFAVLRAARLPPAEAMRPPAPPSYRSGLLARLRRLDQLSIMIVRHIVRFPLRSFMTTAGMAAALGLLVTVALWLDSTNHLLNTEFRELRRYDLQVGLFEAEHPTAVHEAVNLPGVNAVEPLRNLPVRFVHGTVEYEGAIRGVIPGARLERVVDVEIGPVGIPDRGLILSTALAQKLGVGRGDQVRVEVLEGRRPVVDLRVSGLIEVYLGMPAYAHIDALADLMDEDRLVNEIHLAVDHAALPALYEALKERPAVASVVRREAAIETFEETMAESVNIIVGFYGVFAAFLTFGIVYNGARVALSERARELASLRILGFTHGEVAYTILGELALLTWLALPLGCLFGYGLSSLIIASIDSDRFRVPLVIEPRNFGISMIVVIAAATISSLFVWWRVARLDLIAVLKSRE
ncbi:MAG: FtsX-like permease family protein [Pseudomonadota bacterium]